MLVLKMLMLKKDIYFHCGLSSRTSSKSTKKKIKEILLESIIIAIINLLNL